MTPNEKRPQQDCGAWELGMPEVSDLTVRKELPKAGSITGVKS